MRFDDEYLFSVKHGPSSNLSKAVFTCLAVWFISKRRLPLSTKHQNGALKFFPTVSKQYCRSANTANVDPAGCQQFNTEQASYGSAYDNNSISQNGVSIDHYQQIPNTVGKTSPHTYAQIPSVPPPTMYTRSVPSYRPPVPPIVTNYQTMHSLTRRNSLNTNLTNSSIPGERLVVAGRQQLPRHQQQQTHAITEEREEDDSTECSSDAENGSVVQAYKN